MINYVQHDFFVNDITYSTFPFSLEGEDGLRIDVEIANIDLDAHEFNYLIIPEPNINELSINTGNEFDKLLMTSNFYWWRILLNDSIEKTESIEYDNTYKKIDSQINYGFKLVKDHQEVIAMPTCTSNENVELILSNINNYEMDYVLIAFLNWKQIPIDNDVLSKFVKVPSQTNIYLTIKTPYVEEDTPFQIYAIPKPFSNDIKDIVHPTCTLRTNISPK